MRAYILCCNDLQHAVVLDDEPRAKRELEAYAKAEYERWGKWGTMGRVLTYEQFRRQFYFHLHDVSVL